MYQLIVRHFTGYSQFSHEEAFPPVNTVSELFALAKRKRSNFFNVLLVKKEGGSRHLLHTYKEEDCE
jgi:hypothetical protein